MLKYILKRIFRSFITLFAVTTIVFMLMRLMPEEGYFGDSYDKLDEIQREAILEGMGLRDPMHIQLIHFYKGLIKGDLGTSITYRPKVPVTEILAKKIPYSLWLGLSSILIAIIFGLWMGISMAQHKDRLMDGVGTFYIVFIRAVPSAVYYLFLQLYLTSWLKLPILFDVDEKASFFLPLLSMSLVSLAGYAMWMRRYMVDELNKDYIRLAKAKGLRQKEIMFKHVMRNAFVPMAQYLPTSILFAISGSLYIESLYSIPGIGSLLVESIQRQDNPLVQALVLIYAAISIFGLLMGDVLMAFFDPRIKFETQGGGR
ncbi:ABC transporter permease [Fusibacter ferrireducens]|uniref:ABC transporter permease n=1 Tax=Fusibacter ferrireducens TaxID=2785058 RepID=A0ABR9ZXL1_9FIRM|nr:ABC transporter permease [Fusibacter ferrireducens]MBF4695192.1 ABC transporter permease [Fusibacter ferrireducens]